MWASVVKSAKRSVVPAVAGAGAYTYYTWDNRWWWTKRAASPLEVKNKPNWENTLVHGFAKPGPSYTRTIYFVTSPSACGLLYDHTTTGFEAVREEFVENFRTRGELGAAVCVVYRGETVVDLWGGYRNRETQEPWDADTLAPLFSATKGVTAFALALQVWSA